MCPLFRGKIKATTRNCDADNDWYVASVDCNDNDSTTNPNASEESDIYDKNCSGNPAEVSFGKSECVTCIESTVNLGSGNVYFEHNIFKDEFVLSYNSLNIWSRPFGKGWNYSYYIRLVEITGSSLAL